MHKLAISEDESEKEGEKSVALAGNFYSGLEEAERQGKVNRKRVRTGTAAQKAKHGSSTIIADVHFQPDRSSKMPPKQEGSDDEQVIGKVRVKILSLKDLPTFGGQVHEDANDFMGQFESCASVHDWDNKLKV